MIPKVIWQTYKSDYPPQKSVEYIKSWLSFHNGYEWYYMNDKKCEQFVKDNFNDDFAKMYNDLPFGVMKSDVWRVAILYIYGGIYADLDTRCIKSLNEYIEKYDLIVSAEYPTGDIGNFCFAVSPKHESFYLVLEEFLYYYKSKDFLNENSPTPIQDFGAGCFNVAIKKYINNNINNKKIKMFNLEDNAFTPFQTKNSFVHHNTNENVWEDSHWRNKQKKYFFKNETN
jgi:mannosyltransferase OCH1-like enzyme